MSNTERYRLGERTRGRAWFGSASPARKGRVQSDARALTQEYRRRMQSTSGRLVFKMGDAFPADDAVAVFLASLSTALNDLLTTTRWILGGDTEQPNRRQVTNVEQQY